MGKYQYETAMMTDCGNIRPYNQDSLMGRKGSLNGDDFLLLAVADGMGGMDKGELASSEMMNTLDDWWKYSLRNLLEHGVHMEEISSSLSYTIEDGNRRIQKMAQSEGIQTGTTLSLLFLYQKQYVIKHIGDSRIYVLRDGEAMQLSKDHTWCQQEVERGNLSLREAESHSMKHVLVNAIGGNQALRIDTIVGEVKEKDLLILCSDGFYNYMSPNDMKVILGGKGDLQKRLLRAFEWVKQTEASDNLSAILVQRKKSFLSFH